MIPTGSWKLIIPPILATTPFNQANSMQNLIVEIFPIHRLLATLKQTVRANIYQHPTNNHAVMCLCGITFPLLQAQIIKQPRREKKRLPRIQNDKDKINIEETKAKEDAIKGLIVRQWWRHSIDPWSHWIGAYESPQEGDDQSEGSFGSQSSPAKGKLVGGANFRIVRDEKEEEAKRIDTWWLERGSVRREMAEGVMEIWGKIRGRRGAHVAVVVVFTDPSRRRQGIGNMLMEWATRKAG
ncbi:hypothetical protein OCU04_011431 [Sclerotinia nivalis]|uniref:N-acetyltransferase domain-containing protein n=1 Tax=Sclerotinia nivalis TaxID=352851 RepID=A0A9X0ABR0_9HELO|nr:hypothetical protein OCU04_011431 [Sclerotinia nivalis]